MLAIVVSVGLWFKSDENGDLGQVQAFEELPCNSENLEAEKYNVYNFHGALNPA